MKLITFFLLTAILLICTPALSQRVSISGKNIGLEQVFTEIKKQTGFEFFYQSTLLKAVRPVTLHVQQMPVDEVLKICLQGQGLGFNIRSGTIVIFKEDDPANTKQPVVDQAEPADTRVLIKGRVVDDRGQPVEMASIVLMRTNAGALTDQSGAFTLTIKDLQATDQLSISFIGMKSRVVRLDGNTNPGQIVLQTADNVLEQTVIMAYGTTSERFRTGDITTVKAADIEKTPALNMVEALAGRVPGLYVRQNGSNPAGVYNIQLRGVNVIPSTSGMAFGDAVNVLSKPLIVLDGLPMAPDLVSDAGQNIGVDAMTGLTGAGGGQDALYWLNPPDVESITVLKDAEATALYGSRAANGVIIITTKKGKPGKTALSITANTGVNVAARRLKLLNTQQYLAMRHEAWDNTIRAGLPVIGTAGVSYSPNAVNDYDLLVWDTTRYTDWQKVLLGSAPVYNANLELSDGEGRTTYRLAAGYNKSTSSYPRIQGKTGFKEEKGSLSLSISTRSLNNRFKLTAAVITAISASNQPAVNPDNYVLLAPNAPAVFDATGHFNFAEWRPASPFASLITGNPLSTLACLYRSNRFGMQARTSLSYELFHSLVFTIGLGYSRSDGKQVLTQPAASIDPLIANFTRGAIFGNSTGTGFNVEPNARYEVRWGRHHLDVLAGGSYQADKQEGGLLGANGYTSDELMGSPAGAASYSSYTNVIQRKSVAALGRLSYRYADEILVDLSARRDGFSSFGPGRRFGNFGSIGLGWIFTREAWFKNIPLLTFGKIRGSYGLTGSQSANPYAYLSTFRPARAGATMMPNGGGGYDVNGIYQGIPSFAITRIANPVLGWAQAVSLDLGIDLYLLEDQRLKFTVQWYRKHTDNQLVINPVSTVTGTNTYLVNLPAKVENSGLEATADYASPKRRSGIGWHVNVNLSANRNKLRSFPNLENSPLKDYYEIGQSLIRQQLYPTFLDKATGVYRITDADHPLPVPYRVSNYPAFTGGMQAGMSYKGVSFSISCTFARQKGFNNIQGSVQPGTLSYWGVSNQARSVLLGRHWQSAADSTIGGALYAAQGGDFPLLDVYWGDASYIALKNATLNYDLPPALLKKAGIIGIRFYTRAENLLMISLAGYKGMNPEQPGLSTQLPLRMVLVGGFTINL